MIARSSNSCFHEAFSFISIGALISGTLPNGLLSSGTLLLIPVGAKSRLYNASKLHAGVGLYLQGVYVSCPAGRCVEEVVRGLKQSFLTIYLLAIPFSIPY